MHLDVRARGCTHMYQTMFEKQCIDTYSQTVSFKSTSITSQESDTRSPRLRALECISRAISRAILS